VERPKNNVKNNVMKFFTHTHTRPQQKKIINSILLAFDNSQIVLVQSPPGTGKTIACLAPSLSSNPQSRIFWVGHSHKAYENLIEETITLNQRNKTDILLSSFIGKRNMCLLKFATKKVPLDEFYDQCSAAIKYGECPYYDNMYEWNEEISNNVLKRNSKNRLRHLKDIFREGLIFDPREKKEWANFIIEDAKSSELFCPYYAMKELGKDSRIIAWDYYYIFRPIRNKMLSDLEISDETPKTLIVDEADVFYSRFNDVLTQELSDLMIKRLKRNTLKLRDNNQNPDLRETYQDFVEFISSFERYIHEFISKCKIGYQREITKNELLQFLERKRKMNITNLISRIDEIIKEVFSNKARSSTIAIFLTQWFETDEENYLRFIDRSRGKTQMRTFTIKLLPLDLKNVPFYYSSQKPVYLASILKEFEQIIFLSATLHPEIFKERLGLKNAIICDVIDYHISKENYEIIICPFLNSYNDNRKDMIPKYAKLIRKLSRWSDEKLFLLTTSKKMSQKMKNIVTRESPSIVSQVKWSYSYSTETRSIDLEGYKVCLVAGFPLPRYDLVFRKRKDYLKKKHGEEKGETIFNTGAIVETIQGITRILRNPENRGFIVLADPRFSYQRNQKLFPKYYRDKMKIINDLDALESECRHFFGFF